MIIKPDRLISYCRVVIPSLRKEPLNLRYNMVIARILDDVKRVFSPTYAHPANISNQFNLRNGKHCDIFTQADLRFLVIFVYPILAK